MSDSLDLIRMWQQRAAKMSNGHQRRLYAVGVLTRLMSSRSSESPQPIVPIVVGGTALEFYSLGSYATADVDMVVDGRQLAGDTLVSMGFTRHVGERHWFHDELQIAIEIPDDMLAGSYDRVVTVELAGLEVHLIGLEDLILDRLRAFRHWKSLSDGEWASRLMHMHGNRIDWVYLNEHARSEDLFDDLQSLRHDPSP